MLFGKYRGHADQDRKQKRNRFKNAGHASFVVDAAETEPAFQTVDRREKIRRRVTLIDQAQKAHAQTGSGQIRTHERRRDQNKDHRASDFGTDIGKRKTERVLTALSKIVVRDQVPERECQNIDDREDREYGDLGVQAAGHVYIGTSHHDVNEMGNVIRGQIAYDQNDQRDQHILRKSLLNKRFFAKRGCSVRIQLSVENVEIRIRSHEMPL